jgi:replicative superfamily II helicase
MTPEKLAGLLRNDPRALLDRFGLFVVDEAHLISDGDRGWSLEETISLLHHLTRASTHRIVVLSAALGRQAHVVAWLDAGGGVVASSNDWRGPRRLHAIYTTRANWDAQVNEPRQGSRLARRVAPLLGRIHLRGPDQAIYSGTFDDAVGELVLRQTRNGRWTKDTSRSTTQRSHLVPLATHLAESGQVLVVEATRYAARKLAQEIAAECDEYLPSLAVAAFAEGRVGSQHPLVEVLRKGVGFHHAALPADVQAEIEDAVRAGRLRILVATSTLTEGVNLPFKAVVVGERGWGTGERRVELIDPARLLNAVGRAGRAAKETEGWLLLSEHQEFEPGLFEPFDLTAERMPLTSTLTGWRPVLGVNRRRA